MRDGNPSAGMSRQSAATSVTSGEEQPARRRDGLHAPAPCRTAARSLPSRKRAMSSSSMGAALTHELPARSPRSRSRAARRTRSRAGCGGNTLSVTFAQPARASPGERRLEQRRPTPAPRRSAATDMPNTTTCAEARVQVGAAAPSCPPCAPRGSPRAAATRGSVSPARCLLPVAHARPLPGHHEQPGLRLGGHASTARASSRRRSGAADRTTTARPSRSRATCCVPRRTAALTPRPFAGYFSSLELAALLDGRLRRGETRHRADGTASSYT